MNNHIRIIEVGPRDGLQNEKVPIKLDQKITFVKNLFAAGIEELELTSFVRSDKIPQLSDAKELSLEIARLGLLDKCWVLIPNIIGLERALELGFKNFAFFTSASELFNKKNINCNIKESLDRIALALKNITDPRYKKRGYLSMVFGCPYEGQVSLEKSMQLTQDLFAQGIDEISLGDTIGIANPQTVSDCITMVKKIASLDKIAMHFHDTRGLALVNIFQSLQEGVKAFDASAGGLGGCPYAHGATGNVATEDVIYLCEQLGYKTNIDLEALVKATDDILSHLNKKSLSKINQYFHQKLTR